MNNNYTTTAILTGLAILIAITPAVSALQDPYPMDGYIVDKAGNTLSGANVTFTNQNTGEVIYDDSSASGWYSNDAANFPSGYQDGHTIAYMVNYSGTTYQNLSYSFVLDVAAYHNTANITLDQAPAVPTSFTDLGMNLLDHTPTVTWTKGADADSGDTVTTYIYVGTTSTPTTEEGHNTGTTIDLGSTVTLTDGTTYYYRLRSYDGERWSAYTTADQFRMNSEPTVSSVDTDPAVAYTNTGLTGSGTYADAESDAESGTTYKWFKNGAEIAGQTTTSLASSQFVRADEIIFQYAPNDGFEAGTPVNSSVKTISNSVPSVPTTLDLTATIAVGSTLTATGSGSTDTDTGDGDTLTYYYEFKDGVSELQAYSTDNTYVIPQSEAHDTITVNCKVNDGVMYSSAKTGDKAVSDTKPTTPTGSDIDGTTKYVGDVLTVTGAGTTDADGDAVTYQYEFRRTSASGTVVQALSGTNTYTLQTADAHDSIYVNVYGRAYTVNSDAYETENRAVTNSVPVLASIGSKSENDNVQITVDAGATDGDSDTQTYSCNRTDLFSDFSTSTGLGHWTSFYNQTGVYYVDFGVSDGYGGTDNETITVTVNDVTFNTDLFSGWNLIAWVAETDGTAGEFAGIVTDAAYISTKNATTGNYDSFNPAAPDENNFTTIKGKGYYAQTTATAPFSRSRIDDVEYNTTLQSGYSIFGWTNASSMTAEQVATSIGGNCQYLSTKNATTGNYENFNPAAPGENNFVLNTGIAYYARVSSETIWTREA